MNKALNACLEVGISPSGLVEKLSGMLSKEVSRLLLLFTYSIVIRKPTCTNNITLVTAVGYSMATECQGWCCTFFAREKQLSLRLAVLFQTITHRCRVTGPDSTHQHMHVSDFLRTAENRINSVTKKRGPRHSSQVACCYHLF